MKQKTLGYYVTVNPSFLRVCVDMGPPFRTKKDAKEHIADEKKQGVFVGYHKIFKIVAMEETP